MTVTVRSARALLRSMLASLAFAALSTLSPSGHAAEPSIWYRAGEGCPDGASFLERLERRSVRARLAAVGDHVDFVVTLGANGERSSGRLERQTSEGTIALREVDDVRCEAVADALALTLALTLDPASQGPPETAPTAEPATPPSQEAPPPSVATVPAAATTASEPPAPPPPTDRTPPPAEPSAPAERAGIRLGGAIAAWDLFQGPWLLEAGPFAEVEAPASFVLPRASLRIVVQGGLRPDADASVQVWLAAARVEACPLAFGRGSISVRPCAALDAGAIGASAAGADDTAAWSAAAAHARFMLELGRLGLEAQAGGIVPITHYEVTAAGSRTTLEETSDIGFAGGIGVYLRLD